MNEVPRIIDENESAAADTNGSTSMSDLHQKEKDSRMKSIHHFEAIIADPSTTFIDKTRARLELALLHGDDNRNEKSRIKKEIDAIKGVAGVGRAKDKLEQGILSNEEMHLRERSIRIHQEDLALEAKQRRLDAKRRVEEQRKKAADAQKLLSQLEKEAEDAIMKAKDAMKRANEAWVEAGREQKKAQEFEALLEKIQIMADDDPVSKEATDVTEAEQRSVASAVSCIEEKNNEVQVEQGRVNASVDQSANLREEETSSSKQSSSEGYFTKYFKLSIKVEQLEKERDEFDAQLKEKDATIERLTSKDQLHDEKIALLNKLHEETITSLNKLHKKEIESLNEYIKETGQSQMFWKHQSKVLADKLQVSRQRKSEQELEVVIMKDQLDIKLKEIHELKAEIEDLRQTKNEFEAQLSAVEEKQRVEMLKLKADADALIEEKEHALNALQIVQESHLKVLGYQEEEVSVLSDDILEYEKDLEEVKEKERGSIASTEREDELALLSEECRHWKKKSASVSLRLDILKDEVKALKRENAKLKQSADNDRLFSRLLSNYKLEKKKTKDLQLNLRVAKKEAKERDAKIRERDAKIRERDAIIDELTQRNLSSVATQMDEDGQKSIAYWKYEANRMKEKLTKLEKQSRVRDAMVKISSEISSGFKKQQHVQESPLECVSVSFDMEEIEAIGSKKVPNIVSP